MDYGCPLGLDYFKHSLVLSLQTYILTLDYSVRPSLIGLTYSSTYSTILTLDYSVSPSLIDFYY